jgi:hypothetical protein
MQLCVTSQNVYPVKKYINGDTVVLFNTRQTWAIDSSLIRLDECHVLSDTLNSLVRKRDFIIGKQNNLIANHDSQLRLKQDIIDNQMMQVVDLKHLDKYNKGQIKFLKLQRNGLAVLVGVAVLKIFVFK